MRRILLSCLRPSALLAIVILAQASVLFHELEINRYDLNDNVLHVALIEACVEQLRSGGNPLDFWAPEWSLGYPVMRTYQPAAHLLVAGLHLVSGIDLETLFSWVRYLLICAWPLTVFISARWLGLSPLVAATAAMLAPLLATEGLFGLELGSYLWRGSGLFSQSLAMHFFALTLGAGARVLRSGRHLVVTGVVLGATFLAHYIYGYMAALSLVLLALIEGPRLLRLQRTVLVGAVSAVVVSSCLIPLLLDAPTVNRSRWEAAWKWDSLGAVEVMSRLGRGELLDHGRFPSLSVLALFGSLAILWAWWRRRDPSSTWLGSPALFALAGAGMWLALFFGRPTWGGALRLLGLSELTHLHRLLGALHFFLILLAAIGLSRLWASLGDRGWPGGALALATTAAVLAPALAERAAYLEQNRQWGMVNVNAHRSERAQLDSSLALASGQPGRVFPGLGGGWGKDFRVGSVPLSAWLSRRRIPALAYLYHAMARTGDLMVHFDEWRPDHYRLFNVSTVLAPRGRKVAGFLEPVARSGRFQMWRSPEASYFDMVTVEHSATADRSSFYDVNKLWLDSPWPLRQHHLLLDDVGDSDLSDLPRIDPAVPLPPAGPAGVGLPGSVDWQARQGETYRVHVSVTRPSHLLFKMTYHRNWRATVDGEPRPTVMLSPGFIGVALETGGHEVELRYRPEAWRGPLLAASFVLVLLAAWAERRGLFDRLARPRGTST